MGDGVSNPHTQLSSAFRDLLWSAHPMMGAAGHAAPWLGGSDDPIHRGSLATWLL